LEGCRGSRIPRKDATVIAPNGLFIRIRSEGAALTTTHCSFALSRFTGSGSSGSPAPSSVPSKAIRCPPEEPPTPPIRSAEIP